MSLKKLSEKSKGFNLPPENINKRENGRLSFISKFPLAKIKDLSIDEYVQGTDENSFCYWLEFKKILFGIGGGNASKFGVYKAKDGNYYTSFGKNKKQLTDQELENFFINIKSGISQALEYTSNDQIDKIKTIDIPLWNMVLQKILSIYYPDKFITIGASDVLIECARDIKLNGVELKAENSIEINYKCKKALSSLPEYLDWSYEEIGSFIWETYLDDSKRDYYILGSKYGNNNDEDVFSEMLAREAIAIGFASNIDLEEYYFKNHSEITDYLKEKGEEPKSYNALKYFLTLKVGDRIAVKAAGSPKGKKGFLSIIGIAEVIEKDGEIYRHDKNNLGHLINVKFIKAPVYKEFDLGGYGRTIHKLSKPDHIDLIFKNDYKILDMNTIFKDHREEFTNWLTIKYGEDSGTSSSYVKAIDILSQILSKELFKSTDDNYLESLYKDLIKEQRNQEGKYYHSDAPSYGSNGFYSASIKSYRGFLKAFNQTKSIIKDDDMNFPLNTILFGPPGTGKTFALKQDYFPLYSSKETSISADKNFESVVKSCSWWEVIAVALIQLGDSKVKDIHNHKWVQKKEELSNSKTIKPTIWSQLQAHTIDECEFVNVKSRQQPLIFNKTINSKWNIVAEEVKNQIPELYDLIEKVENFIPDANKTIERYKFVTFHQSYSYEDFIEGIKPVMTEDDITQDLYYKIEDGVFKALCEEARNDPSNKYAIFIDEINRGNVSAIFGELITLIEQDKRQGEANEISVQLPYSKALFSVPPNIDIYGTMNTADRSVEALDTALRRRFSFVEMMPDASLLENNDVEGINLEDVLNTINNRIEILIDRDHTIGHSYFMNVKTTDDLRRAFKDKIVPLLQEYFYGDYGKIGLVLGQGFVKSHSKSKNPFADFKYEGKEELNRDFFDLVAIDDEFDILKALENLLNKPKDNQD